MCLVWDELLNSFKYIWEDSKLRIRKTEGFSYLQKALNAKGKKCEK